MPGRPSTRRSPRRPCIIGLPGRMAIFQKPISTPSRSSACLHEVVVADRCAAGRHEDVGAGFDRAADRGRGVVHGVAGDAEIDDVGALVRARARAAHSRSNRRSGRGPASCPASPVRRRSQAAPPSAGDAPAGVGWFIAAASARSRSSKRCDCFSSTSPSRKSMPARRMCRPVPAASLMTTMSPSRAVSSWMTIASAPSGITPPVKMRTASPACSDARRTAGRRRPRR